MHRFLTASTAWAAAFLAVAMTALLATGCAPAPSASTVTESTVTESTAAESTVDAATSPTSEAAEEVASAIPTPTPIVVFSVGVNPEFEPFVFYDENGNLAGFDIELLNALSAAGDFEFSYVTSTFNGLLQGLNSDSFDAAISAITVTDERVRTVDFTRPYFGAGQAVVSYLSAGQGMAVRTDNTAIMGADQLTEGVRVGVKANTTGERYVVDNTAAEFVRFEEAPAALDALAAGEIDAVVVDTPVIVYYMRQNPQAGLRLAGGPLTQEEYAIAVAKNEPELLATLDAALETIVADGVYDQIFTKWFGAP